MMDGKGTYTYANHTKYEGTFEANNFIGRGRFTDSDGDVHEGVFEDH